ncbi:MAG: DEAD/DEAH box helicase [Cyanobacteria bacterium K_DeepCast_35m_m2_023]|nr:DEAD/DEAH box helicase [Cyanobacteria bacterium K_DeepCast_35m_m2_023]
MRLGATGAIEVVSPFDAVTQAQLRAVRPRGSWCSRRRCWDFPLEAALVLRQQLGSRFALDPELERWLRWLERPLPPLPPHRELVAAAHLQQPLPDGRQLFAHQRSGVRWLLARRGAVLADAMGLGKTLTALVAARALVRLIDCRVVVLAPVGLHSHWQREAAALQLQLVLFSWAAVPEDLPEAGCVLIVDEAHYAQNGNARRSKALLRLARHPRLRACWLLTGTPMKNGRPAQLFPLLAAIGHPIAADQRAFEQRYCGGYWREQGGRRQWSAQGASALPELQRLVRPLLLHRRKQDCLDLPPKHRQHWPVALTPQQAEAFDRDVDASVRDYRLRASLGLVRRDAEALALLTTMRQLASHYTPQAAVELIAPLLQHGEPVVVFTAFVASAQALHARLAAPGDPGLLIGSLPAPLRQQQVDAFQRGAMPLLVATYGTGGLGYTLHRARHVVLLERPWTPGDAEQAEDRCHRIGMGAALQCHWLTLGPADQLVDALIASKAERIAVVLQHKTHELRRQRLAAMVEALFAGR